MHQDTSIMTTAEARKRLGAAYANLSDEEVDTLVKLLGRIANEYVLTSGSI